MKKISINYKYQHDKSSIYITNRRLPKLIKTMLTEVSFLSGSVEV